MRIIATKYQLKEFVCVNFEHVNQCYAQFILITQNLVLAKVFHLTGFQACVDS